MITRKYTVEVPQYERIYTGPMANGNFTTRQIAPKFVEVELAIDDNMLASYLGVRANGSKRKVSAYMDGMVKAKIIREVAK